jgi:hypothetical protein
MSVSQPVTDVLQARRQALHALDGVVRAALTAAATQWRLPESSTIERTDYPRVYGRTPALGGHWTLFGTTLNDSHHTIATVTVALEFDGDRPVDLWVSGEHDVAAGGCTIKALAEALEQCGGPLRQVTPLSFDTRAMMRPLHADAISKAYGPTIALN